MLGGKAKPNYDKPTTIIGKDTVIDCGVINAKTSIQINGVLKGDMKIEASVAIGENGRVEGNIDADFVLVAGVVTGNVAVKEQVHLTKTAQIMGDIKCGSIIVDDGARIQGNFGMHEAIAAKPVVQGE